MTQGNQIVTVAGHCPVRLKGVDIPGLEYNNTGDGPSGAPNKPLAVAQEAVNNWSCNFVRLTLNQDRWLGTACGTNVANYQALVQGVVDWCNTHNAYVLLDLHWNDLGSAGGGNVCTGGQHDMPDDNSLLFWQSVASMPGLANNPAVFFDLYNEPGGATGSSALSDSAAGWGLWRNGGTVPAAADGAAYHTPGMQALLMAIRAAGANNMVWAGGQDWAFRLGGIVSHAAALTDTASGAGVVYATHIYPWKNGSCTSSACFDTAVPPAVLSAYPVMVTEFGPNSGDPDGFVAPLIDWINLHNLSYCAWSMNPGTAPCLIGDWPTFSPTSYFGTPFLNELLSTNPLGCNPATATPSPTPSASPTPLPACGSVVLYRINSAGPAYSDSNGDPWTVDSHFSGGSASSTTVTVTGTADPTLFKTNRWGNPLSYNFSLPNGTYLVTVLESENYWSGPGSRVFSLSLQGSVVEPNLDIYAASGGKFKAMTLTYTATVSTGTLNLVANASIDNAQFAGVEVMWIGPACSPTPTPYAGTPTDTPTMTASPTPSASPTPNLFASDGPLAILSAQPVPNPNPSVLTLCLNRAADSVTVDVFSTGFSQVLELKQGQLHGGYNNVALPAAWKTQANGLYFVRVRAKLGGQEAPPRTFKLMKLR